MPNTKESWGIPIHLFANSLSLPPTGIDLLLLMVLEAGILDPQMVLEDQLLAVLAHW